jgi:site-specific recombinase XerC
MIADVNWEEEFGNYPNDINKQWEFFLNKYKEFDKLCVPKKEVYINGKLSKKFSMPLSQKNLDKIKQKNKLWSKMRKNLATEEEKLSYRRIKNQIRQLTRKARKLLEKNIASNVKSNPKLFWKYSQHKLKSKSSIPDLQKTANPKTFSNSDSEKM